MQGHPRVSKLSPRTEALARGITRHSGDISSIHSIFDYKTRRRKAQEARKSCPKNLASKSRPAVTCCDFVTLLVMHFLVSCLVHLPRSLYKQNSQPAGGPRRLEGFLHENSIYDSDHCKAHGQLVEQALVLQHAEFSISPM